MIGLLAVLAIFGAIVCLVMGLSWREESPLTSRMAILRGERPAIEFRAVKGPESVGTRVLGPMLGSLGSKLELLVPARWIADIDLALLRAGEPVTRTGFLMAMFFTEVALVSFGATMLAAGHLAATQAIGMMAACAVFGVLLPKIWLGNKVRYRQKEILKSLPDAFDLITVCVEAGLGLDASLGRVAEKSEGPFGEELAISLREISMGKLRRDSLRELANRTGVQDLTSFINAIVQAETMGTSIATVLRVQAEQMRTRRSQRAEQQAHQAPIKMMFPLVLCIFPTLFIVILGPAGITLYKQLVAR